MNLVEPKSLKSSNFINLNTLSFEPNEFTDYKDPVGFLESEVSPKKFLTPGNLYSANYMSENKDDGRPRYSDRPNDALPTT